MNFSNVTRPFLTHSHGIRMDSTRVKGAARFSTLKADENSIPKALQIIKDENDAVKAMLGSEEYNFMPSANNALKNIILQSGPKCIEPCMELLLDPTFDGPGARFVLGNLATLVPTRQSGYEKLLDALYPTWQYFLTVSSPQ